MYKLAYEQSWSKYIYRLERIGIFTNEMHYTMTLKWGNFVKNVRIKQNWSKISIIEYVFLIFEGKQLEKDVNPRYIWLLHSSKTKTEKVCQNNFVK